MKTSHKITLGAAAGVLSVGSLIGVGQAIADPAKDNSPNPTASSSTDSQHSQDAGRGGKSGHRMDDALSAKLAEKLGLDQTQVTEAIQAAHETIRSGANGQPGSGKPTAEERTARQEAFVTELSNHLGVDVENLRQVMTEIRDEDQADNRARLQARLDDAVAAGTLTQAEADAVLKAAETGVIGYGPAEP